MPEARGMRLAASSCATARTPASDPLPGCRTEVGYRLWIASVRLIIKPSKSAFRPPGPARVGPAVSPNSRPKNACLSAAVKRWLRVLQNSTNIAPAGPTSPTSPPDSKAPASASTAGTRRAVSSPDARYIEARPRRLCWSTGELLSGGRSIPPSPANNPRVRWTADSRRVASSESTSSTRTAIRSSLGRQGGLFRRHGVSLNRGDHLRVGKLLHRKVIALEIDSDLAGEICLQGCLGLRGLVYRGLDRSDVVMAGRRSHRCADG